jgi:hypothetical protein
VARKTTESQEFVDDILAKIKDIWYNIILLKLLKVYYDSRWP